MDTLLFVIYENLVYSISGGSIVLLLIVSLVSDKLNEGLREFLWVAVLLWGICVGYEANTGNDISYWFNNYGKDSGLKPYDLSRYK